MVGDEPAVGFEFDSSAGAHPACAHLGTRWSWHDEVYQFRDLRGDARVLGAA